MFYCLFSAKILCQALDCLLWCHKQKEDAEIDAKIIFHSKYYFNQNIIFIVSNEFLSILL